MIVQQNSSTFTPQERQHAQHVLNILNVGLMTATKKFGEALEERTTVSNLTSPSSLSPPLLQLSFKLILRI